MMTLSLACIGGYELAAFVLIVFVMPVTVLTLIIQHLVGAAVNARRDRRVIRRIRGICEACGYDLRATPSRCPECGTFAERIAPDVMLSEGVMQWLKGDAAQIEVTDATDGLVTDVG